MADDLVRPLSIPVILGTQRTGRMSEHAARVVLAEIQKRPGIETELIDAATLPIPSDEAGDAAKDPAFAEAMNRADAIVHRRPGVQPRLPGTPQARPRHEPARVHPQGGRRGRGLGGDLRRRADDPEPAPRPARAGSRHDLLGRERQQRADALRRERSARRRLVPRGRQVPRRARLDGARRCATAASTSPSETPA